MSQKNNVMWQKHNEMWHKINERRQTDNDNVNESHDYRFILMNQEQKSLSFIILIDYDTYWNAYI